VPFRKYRHLHSRFHALNLFRGILIAGAAAQTPLSRTLPAYLEAIAKNVKVPSKTRERPLSLYMDLCFDGVLMFAASYWAWIVGRERK